MPKISDRLLLDTHVWLWLIAGSKELGRAARQAIEAALRAGTLSIAAISLWEVALLAARQRIVLDKPVKLWLDEALAAPGPEIEPLTSAIAAESCGLPDGFHAGPADRMIVATARITGATLITRDHRILDWAARGHVNIMRA